MNGTKIDRDALNKREFPVSSMRQSLGSLATRLTEWCLEGDLVWEAMQRASKIPPSYLPQATL